MLACLCLRLHLSAAGGSTVATTGSSFVGSHSLLTTPQLSEALVPQSAVEGSRAFTVLRGGQLRVLSTASSQPLLDATRAVTPATSTSATSGEYFFPYGTLTPFLPRGPVPTPDPPSPSPFCVTVATKAASVARYYTSKLSNLQAVVYTICHSVLLLVHQPRYQYQPLLLLLPPGWSPGKYVHWSFSLSISISTSTSSTSTSTTFRSLVQAGSRSRSRKYFFREESRGNFKRSLNFWFSRSLLYLHTSLTKINEPYY